MFLFSSRFPFDWSDPVLYLVAFVAVFLNVYCGAMVATTIINYTIASCCMLLALLKDLKQDVTKLIEMSKNEECQAKLKDTFSEFVEFHVTVKTLSFLTTRFSPKTL